MVLILSKGWSLETRTESLPPKHFRFATDRVKPDSANQPPSWVWVISCFI